jgi:hypothetical protein
MQIEILGEGSISPQTRTYAEYCLFAALSEVIDSARVRRAALVLRRATRRHGGEGVSCTVTVEIERGEVLRIRTTGEHPNAAINNAMERLRKWSRPARPDRVPEHANAD